jgi:hypothetical protein
LKNDNGIELRGLGPVWAGRPIEKKIGLFGHLHHITGESEEVSDFLFCPCVFRVLFRRVTCTGHVLNILLMFNEEHNCNFLIMQ